MVIDSCFQKTKHVPVQLETQGTAAQLSMGEEMPQRIRSLLSLALEFTCIQLCSEFEMMLRGALANVEGLGFRLANVEGLGFRLANL